MLSSLILPRGRSASLQGCAVRMPWQRVEGMDSAQLLPQTPSSLRVRDQGPAATAPRSPSAPGAVWSRRALAWAAPQVALRSAQQAICSELHVFPFSPSIPYTLPGETGPLTSGPSRSLSEKHLPSHHFFQKASWGGCSQPPSWLLLLFLASITLCSSVAAQNHRKSSGLKPPFNSSQVKNSKGPGWVLSLGLCHVDR